jgi:hypothetical protein
MVGSLIKGDILELRRHSEWPVEHHEVERLQYGKTAIFYSIFHSWTFFEDCLMTKYVRGENGIANCDMVTTSFKIHSYFVSESVSFQTIVLGMRRAN